MPSHAVKTLPDIAETIELQAREISTLTDEVLDLRRDHRADLDRVRLELESLKLFIAEHHPDFAERFSALRRRADQEISPE